MKMCEFFDVDIYFHSLQELIDEQDRGGKKSSMAIARCYPGKNRDQDSMPCECLALTLSGPSYQKLHIAPAPSNFSIIASF